MSHIITSDVNVRVIQAPYTNVIASPTPIDVSITQGSNDSSVVTIPGSDILVVAQDTPINVTVGQVGLQGPPGTGGGGIGVTSLNTLLNDITLAGFGNITITNNGQIINISGDTTASSGLSIGVGDSRYLSINSGDLYYLKSNPSGYITGFNSGLYVLKSDTGNYQLYFVTRNETGQFYPLTNPSGYISNSGFALISFVTGISGNIQSQINLLNNNTGNYLLRSETGQFYPSSNPSGFITGIDTTQFYLSSNPQGYATSGDLSGVSGILNDKINSINAGVSSLNNLSGALSLEGRGNITISTGIGTIYISGTDISGSNVSLSGYITTGDADNRYYTKNNESGFLNTLSGLSTGYVQDVSGALSIRIESSGSYLYSLINASSAGVSSINTRSGALNLVGAGNISVTTDGQTITVSGDTGAYNLFATKIDLGTTGQTLYNQIISTNNNLTQTGIVLLQNTADTGNALQNQINSITNGTGSFTGLFYPLYGNPSGFINGLALVPYATNLYVENTSGYLSIRLGDTGSFLFNLITGNSGLFQSQINNLSFVSVTGISITGGDSLTGRLVFTGIGGISLIQSDNTIQISGATGDTFNTINNLYAVNSGSGIFIYRSGITSGVSQQFIRFPTILDLSPIVIATLHNDTNEQIIALQVSGANPTGFYATFSDYISDTGYYLDIFASNSSQTGMATNVIVNNNITIQSTGWWSKSMSVEYPVPGDNLSWFYTCNNIEVKKMVFVVRGLGLASGNCSIRFSPDRTSVGTELLTNGFSFTGRSIGTTFTNFTNPIITGDNFVWMTVMATGGTLSGIHQTLFYNNL